MTSKGKHWTLSIATRKRQSEARQRIEEKKKLDFLKMLNPDMAYLMGVYLGDGYAYKTYFVLQTADYDFAKSVQNAIIKLFNRSQRIGKYDGLWNINLGYKHFALFLRDFFSMKTVIPEIILNSCDEIKGAFLKGFFDSEGSVYIKSWQIGVTQKQNVPFFSLIMKMVESFGIKCGVMQRYSYSFRKGDLVCENCKSRNCPCVIERFCISGFNDIKKFQKVIGFSIHRKQEALEKMLISYKIKHRPNEIYQKAMKLSKEKSIPEIAKEMNIPYCTVWQWVNNIKIPYDVRKCQIKNI